MSLLELIREHRLAREAECVLDDGLEAERLRLEAVEARGAPCRGYAQVWLRNGK